MLFSVLLVVSGGWMSVSGRGAELRTAVMLFPVLLVASGGRLSVSWRGAELRTAVGKMFGREAYLARGGAASGILGPSERRASGALVPLAGRPTLYVVVLYTGDWAVCLGSCIPASSVAVLNAVETL